MAETQQGQDAENALADFLITQFGKSSPVLQAVFGQMVDNNVRITELLGEVSGKVDAVKDSVDVVVRANNAEPAVP